MGQDWRLVQVMIGAPLGTCSGTHLWAHHRFTLCLLHSDDSIVVQSRKRNRLVGMEHKNMAQPGSLCWK